MAWSFVPSASTDRLGKNKNMSAATYDIVIEQGSTFLLGLVFKDAKKNPVDLTGVTGVGQVRKNLDDDAALADFVVTFDSNRSTGKVTLSIPDSVTSSLDFSTGSYDLKFTYTSGITKRVMKGRVTLDKEVTR